MQIGFYVLIPVVLVVAFNSWINSKAKKVQYQCSVEVIPYQRRIGYLQSICSDFSFVKETRINDCVELIDEKYSGLSKMCYSFMKNNKTTKSFSYWWYYKWFAGCYYLWTSWN